MNKNKIRNYYVYKNLVFLLFFSLKITVCKKKIKILFICDLREGKIKKNGIVGRKL